MTIKNIFVQDRVAGREGICDFRVIVERLVNIVQDGSDRRNVGVMIGFGGQVQKCQHFHVATNGIRVCFIQVVEP